MSAWKHRTLVAGETVEIPDTGERFLVERVGPCSATVRPLAETPREVTIGDRTFTAKSTGHRQEWSPRAIVRHLS